MSSVRPSLDPAVLRSLATPSAPQPPAERYRGSGQDVALADLHEEDRAFVRDAYRHLEGFYRIWRESPRDPDWERLAREVSRFTEPAFRDAALAFGARSRNGGEAPERLQRVLHDVRGGGLSASLAQAEIMTLRSPSPEELARDTEGLQSLVFLARDHAKMMRNAIRDVDEEGRLDDEAERPHYIAALVDRWNGRRYIVGDRSAEIRASADRDGALSSCCLEASAVDRILYNHIANATRFSRDGWVEVRIEHRDESLVRVVIANPVEEDQRDWLASRLADDPGALYRSGVTRGGQGLGLANVAHFVTAAFGLDRPATALDLELLGGRLVDDLYVAWFHWPTYGHGPKASQAGSPTTR